MAPPSKSEPNTSTVTKVAPPKRTFISYFAGTGRRRSSLPRGKQQSKEMVVPSPSPPHTEESDISSKKPTDGLRGWVQFPELPIPEDSSQMVAAKKTGQTPPQSKEHNMIPERHISKKDKDDSQIAPTKWTQFPEIETYKDGAQTAITKDTTQAEELVMNAPDTSPTGWFEFPSIEPRSAQMDTTTTTTTTKIKPPSPTSLATLGWSYPVAVVRKALNY